MTGAGYAMPRGLVIPLGTAAIVITVAGIRAVAWLIAPALLALVIVITLSPAHKWLRRHGFPGWAATTALVVLVYGVLLLFGLVVVASVAKLIAVVPQYTERLRTIGGHAADLAGRIGIEPRQAREVTNSLDLGKLVTAAGRLLGGLTGLTTSLVFLLALLLFFSAETSGIDRRLAEIARDRPRIRLALHDFAGRTRRYLVVTTVFGFAIAVVDGLALLWLGIPLALLWGLLSFVTNYIPNIGFLIGVAPPALLGLLASGWQLMLAVIVVYVVINFVGQSLIQPRFVGDAVGLSTVLTFVSLVFWAWVLGPLGVLLAVPATLLVMALLVDVDPGARWASALVSAPAREKHRRQARPSEAGDVPAASETSD